MANKTLLKKNMAMIHFSMLVRSDEVIKCETCRKTETTTPPHPSLKTQDRFQLDAEKERDTAKSSETLDFLGTVYYPPPLLKPLDLGCAVISYLSASLI